MRNLSQLIGLVLVLAIPAAHAETWLHATTKTTNGETLTFSIEGENKDEPVGGKIHLGDGLFEIEKISVRNLIGARRNNIPAGEAWGEFAIFSSSFSRVTATGQPWVAANHYLGCHQDYNAFLAIYRVADQSATEAQAISPYASLPEKLDLSDQATVYCFFAEPPAG